MVARQAVVAGAPYRDGESQVSRTNVDSRTPRFAETVLATGYSPDTV